MSVIRTSLHGRMVGLGHANQLIVPGGFQAGEDGAQQSFGLGTVSMFDDFIGDVIADEWGVAKGSDAACVDFAVSAAVNGMLRATMGAGAGASMAANGVQLHSALNWKASSGGLVFEARVKMSAITNVAVFVGLTDQIGSLEFPATLGGSDALTTNASDAVGFLFDTAADTDNWFAVGVAADVDATKQNLAVAPVADTYEKFRIELTSGGAADFFRNGIRIGSRMTGAVTAGTSLTPVIAGFARAAASRTLDADYVLVEATRA